MNKSQSQTIGTGYKQKVKMSSKIESLFLFSTKQRKMKIIIPLFFSFFLITSCGSSTLEFQNKINDKTEVYDYTIVFGSCNPQDEPQPLWTAILKNEPDLFLWGGDNIYADTKNMAKIEADYQKQLKHKDYQKLLETTPILGTWDDHDYGKNDGGKEWEYKEESQQLFLDFFAVPKDSPRRKQEGVYVAETFEQNGKAIKVIILDTRYFRSKLKASNASDKRYEDNENGTILGQKQWAWLTNELRNSTANYNLVLSSIQVLSGEHGFETWGNFPSEVQKMEKLILNSEAKNVILLSGDRHISEFSKKELVGLNYPLVDFTSSGLTHSYSNFSGEPNEYRMGKVVSDLSFGLLKFDFETGKVKMEMRGKNNVLQQEIIIDYIE